MASALRGGRFVDTMKPPVLSIRGQRAYMQSKPDLRDTQKYDRQRQVDPVAAKLRSRTMTTAGTTSLHRSTQRKPVLKKTLRDETHDTIHGMFREKKAIVFHLRRVEENAGWGRQRSNVLF